jgi:hypothetical protein
MDEKKKIEKALMELKFLDEPDLDVGLLAIKSISGCGKDCVAGHCGGQTDDCKTQRMCNGKCLVRGDCLKQSEEWCAHQKDEGGTICRGKCTMRGVL